MIVHHETPQFVYYAPSKTGTTSISRLLESIGCRFTLKAKHEISVPNPKTLDYFFFITARNPFSRLVSIYRYAQDRDKWQNPHQVAVHELIKKLSFAEFVTKFVTNGHMLMFYPEPGEEDLAAIVYPDSIEDGVTVPTYSYLLTPQSHYLKVMPRQDLIIHTESFAEDVRKLPFLPSKSIKIPHVNTTEHGPWQDYYTALDAGNVAEEVVEYYKEDFELFGYSTEVK